MLAPRQSACSTDDAGRFCVYYPDDPAFPTLQSVIADMETPGVVFVAPFSWEIASALQADIHRFHDSPGSSMSNPRLLKALPSMTASELMELAAHSDRDATVAVFIRALAQLAAITGACPDGLVAGPLPVGNEGITTPYGCWPAEDMRTRITSRGAVLYDRIEIRPVVASATIEAPAPVHGRDSCTVLTSYSGLVVSAPLHVDNTNGCVGTTAAVQFVGFTAADSSVTVHAVHGVFLAASYLGYDPMKGTLSRKLLDVSNTTLVATGSYDSLYEATYAHVVGTAPDLIDCGGKRCSVLCSRPNPTTLAGWVERR